jgi:transcriptional antiterminator NusG
MEWFVLHVHTGKELDVRDDLRGKEYEAAVPRELSMERSGGVWHERVRLYFPGYVFVRCEMDERDFYVLSKTADVLRILGAPTPLPPDEAEYIEWLTPTDDPLGMSHAVRVGYKRIKITNGPLMGKEGWIFKYDARARRARVQLRMFGEVHAITMALIIDAQA